MMQIDADILLWINGHYTAWLDEVMWTASAAKTWIWLYLSLVLLIIRRFRNWKTVLLILIAFGVAVGISDYLTSGIIKPLVCRLRPTHEPGIDPIRLIHGYVGGKYGFCSSHAANTMAIALLFSLLYKDARATVSMMAWVALNCYSRMYLGVHYPGDIIAGLLVGGLSAAGCYQVLVHVLRAGDGVARQGDS